VSRRFPSARPHQSLSISLFVFPAATAAAESDFPNAFSPPRTHITYITHNTRTTTTTTTTYTRTRRRGRSRGIQFRECAHKTFNVPPRPPPAVCTRTGRIYHTRIETRKSRTPRTTRSGRVLYVTTIRASPKTNDRDATDSRRTRTFFATNAHACRCTEQSSVESRYTSGREGGGEAIDK